MSDRPDLLAIMTEPEGTDPAASHFNLFKQAVGERATVWRIDPARAPLGPPVSYWDDGTASETRLDGKRLDPFAVLLMPATRHVHNEVLERSLVLKLRWQAHARGEHPDRMLDRTLLDLDTDPLQLDWACRAVSHHYQILRRRFPRARWVNDAVALDLVGDRPTQLDAARRLRIPYPRTLETSDPSPAPGFVAAELERDGCVMKSATKAVFLAPDGTEMIVPAVGIRAVDEIEYENLVLGPMIFQQRIRGRPIRVIVIAQRVFAAEIIPDSRPGPHDVDHRIHPYQLVRHSMPSQAERAFVRLVKDLGLEHGEIDVKLTESGEYVLLEVNSNGNWADVELETEQPVSTALADHLLADRRRLWRAGWATRRTP